MRFSKSLLMMFAGLGLFACNNNDDIVSGNQFDGPVDVAVKINLPGAMTRSIDTPSGGDAGTTLDVNIKEIQVSLHLANGQAKVETVTGEEYKNNKEVTFERVENPSKVSVKVNYKDDYVFSFADANDINKYAGLTAPMYGENDKFSTSEGVAKITVDVEHKLARLEFGGITHVVSKNDDAEDLPCIFTDDLTIAGSFLQNVKTAEVKTWEQFQAGNYWDKFETDNKFVVGKIFPANAGEKLQCIAYNIEGNTLPIFTLAFDNVSYTDEYELEHSTMWVGTHGYAIVNQYKIKADGLSQEQVEAFGATYNEDATEYVITQFPAGYIYRVTSLEVPDSAIKPTITGDGVSVVATVNIIPWTVVDGEIEWK